MFSQAKKRGEKRILLFFCQYFGVKDRDMDSILSLKAQR